MADVVMHLSLSPDKALEDAKRELQYAQATLSGLGKKGLLERQTTYDKKVTEAQAAVEAAKSRIITAQAAVDAAKIGQAFKPKEQKESSGSEAKMTTEAKVEKKPLSAVHTAAELVRKLKVEGAPQISGQAVVRAAVEAHALEHLNSLRTSADASPADIKIAEQNCSILKDDPLVFTQLEASARNVRVLKIQGASPEKIQAAEAAYRALESGGGALANGTSESSSQTSTASTGTTNTHHMTGASSSSEPTTQAPFNHTLVQPTPFSTGLAESATITENVREAAERVKSLKAAKAPQAEVKAAVDAYVALASSLKQDELKSPAVPMQTGLLATAADKVRALKAAKAPHAEVKAAVDAYVTLTGSTSTRQEASQTTALDASAAAASSSSSTVEVAADRVRSLKAAKAPQAEVKIAVDAYVSLMNAGSPHHKSNNASESEVSAAIESHNVEEAAEKVRVLKTNKASQPAVKAAVDAYSALLNTTTSASSSRSTTNKDEDKQQRSTQAASHVESKEWEVSQAQDKAWVNPELERAAERVRTLKTAIAPQVEVKAAVEAFIVEEARDKVRRLKAARASQEVVKAAVEEFVALSTPQSAATVSEPSTEQTNEAGHAVNVHFNDN